ncbi:ShlB/FhaC/HecB family hemolysin secretion/activation protein [Leptolyngbya sp. GGD]|uniref:ShlB/FhaC/HecB family hemolysin secretion/activation protein n=1 Tax=Leptolyngbya sp. GGD TaxID=2997907 RepID=UPI00227BE1AA|nr:ShlB/FhaC/HecB family hemolysin secretion/activation protein [Leptolyngbya sp. GGD]MCY6494274.1 BamA/TamA family outer membrane protein [Leptolyngbya sp. GGD]
MRLGYFLFLYLILGCSVPVLVTATEVATVQTITVKKIRLIGENIPPTEEVTSILTAYEQRSLTLQNLQDLADQLTNFYVQKGYVTSRVILADQRIAAGEVAMLFQGGKLETVEIEGTKRLNPSYIRDRIRPGQDRIIGPEVQKQLRLLKTDPMFRTLEAAIRPGSTAGESKLIITVEEAESLQASVGTDNFSPPSVGGERTTSTVTYRNLIGLGDVVNFSYSRSFSGGLNAWDLTYQVPLNSKHGTLAFRVAPTRSRVTQSDFADFGIRGRSTVYEMNYRQPLIRNINSEVALTLGVTVQNGQTFLFDDNPFPFGIGADERGNSRLRVLKFGQEYLRRGEYDAWALRSQFNLGLNILNATSNPGPIPDGQFVSWLGQIQRIQQVGNDHLLVLQGDLHLTPDSLLPAQQFILGGGQSLRGYRQSVRSADNGFRFSIEDQITLQRNTTGRSILLLAPFFELGSVWNKANNPNRLRGETFLMSTGLGLVWQPSRRFQMRLDYGLPLVKLSDRSSNLQDQAFYFSVRYGVR